MKKIYRPAIEIFPPENIVRRVADRVVSLINKKPDAVLILPTGSTPVDLCSTLVQKYEEGAVDFSRAAIFNLDEYWPIDPDNKSSYVYYMKNNLISHINIKPENWHIFNGTAEDPDHEAHRYEEELTKYRQPDIAVLGIGPGKTCHIGFNERGSDENTHARYIELDPETVEANKQYFSTRENMPKGALTLGIANILSARKIFLMAKGENKAWGIQRSVNGPINSDAPASFLRFHPDVTYLLDNQAATLLNQ